MAFTAADVIRQALVTLLDDAATRWPWPEMLGYCNAAVREIVAKKPNAVSRTVEISLVPGAVQEMAPDHVTLTRATRNLTLGQADPGGPAGGVTIKMLPSTALLDASFPGWMDQSVMPRHAIVAYLIYDLRHPRQFLVAPGNDGTGRIEVVAGVLPPAIATPDDAIDPAAYAALVMPLGDLYLSPCVDFVLYRALAKDGALPGAAERAAAHRALFDTAIKDILTAEAAMSPAG